LTFVRHFPFLPWFSTIVPELDVSSYRSNPVMLERHWQVAPLRNAPRSSAQHNDRVRVQKLNQVRSWHHWQENCKFLRLSNKTPVIKQMTHGHTNSLVPYPLLQRSAWSLDRISSVWWRVASGWRCRPCAAIAAPIPGEDSIGILGPALVPNCDQALGLLKDQRLRRAPLRHFLLGRGAALILHLAPVEAHGRMVAERSSASSGRAAAMTAIAPLTSTPDPEYRGGS
jgi:hypothetical protein